MQNPVKTNCLAMVSFASGLIAILCIGLIFGLQNVKETAGGILVGISDGIIMPLRNLSVLVALVTGVLALIQIKKKGGTEKGKIFAWLGIVLSTGWILFALIVGISFLLAEILH
jgi:hypothetical protein